MYFLPEGKIQFLIWWNPYFILWFIEQFFICLVFKLTAVMILWFELISKSHHVIYKYHNKYAFFSV